MKKKIMEDVSELKDFEENLYKVDGKGSQDTKLTKGIEDSTMYLIATSEQPLCAMHNGEWLDEKVLPIK